MPLPDYEKQAELDAKEAANATLMSSTATAAEKRDAADLLIQP